MTSATPSQVHDLAHIAEALAWEALTEGLTPIEFRIGPDMEEAWEEMVAVLLALGQAEIKHPGLSQGYRELMGLPVKPMQADGLALRTVRKI